jgi:hypothetical protein
MTECYDCRKTVETTEMANCKRQVCKECQETALIQFANRPETLKLYREECDCQNPPPDDWDGKSGVFHVSNHCPIHNLYPLPPNQP